MPWLQCQCQKILNEICIYWVSLNNIFVNKIAYIEECHQDIDLQLSKQSSYLVVSNHQSWLDILILQNILHKKVPALKFFLKSSLIWVPVLGICWWALGFPFMKRYSKSYLKKYPHKAGLDIIATQKACQQFKVTPVCIMNYPEGTRFSKDKHQQQNSPFQYLLRPKAGGLGYALPILGQTVDSLLDLTIVYPDENNSVIDFLSGNVGKVKVHLRQIEIPKIFYDMDYQNDEKLRLDFQQWLNERWQEKDVIIGKLADGIEYF